MKKWAGLASVTALASLLASATQAQDCEAQYELQPDDSLKQVAIVAYEGANSGGDSSLRSIYSQLLLSRNSGVIFDIQFLPTYSTIVIPCIEGSGLPAPDKAALALHQKRFDETEVVAGSEAVIAALREDEASDAGTGAAATDAGATVAAFDPAQITKIRFLTAGGQAPYVDATLPGGGMAMELVEKSMERFDTNPSYSVLSIDDKTHHLQDLLIDGSFDVGFPWFRPQCDADQDTIRLISSRDVWMCKNFEFSGPLFETIQAFYVRKGEFTSDATFKDMAGKTICRPHGTYMTDLIARGLEIRTMKFNRPKKLEDCFALLMVGAVDAVSTDALETEKYIVQNRIGPLVQELPQLSTVWSVHAVAPKAKPHAVAALSIVDKGLYDLKINGEWFQIVAPYLSLE
ncbi:MAG: substrate-binding periplasmic protein [Pikeienuella sp.]